MSSDPHRDHAVVRSGRWLTHDELTSEFGWTLDESGLCRDDACVIVPEPGAVERDGSIDVLAVAELLGRPAVIDDEADLVAIGVPRVARREALGDLAAADFVLPDLDGMPTALSDHRSKKRLLVAFSSW